MQSIAGSDAAKLACHRPARYLRQGKSARMFRILWWGERQELQVGERCFPPLAKSIRY
ncbi:hypothetical protein [Candidatus Cryosericum septentrionale]|jgi:hypothetical protein|uniref:hypothetical protein n=1 Tax=Candidatus Cryosericum septentrionale TaxID=2290913 RepID=UPI001401D3B3|nr:hypothetical protein [Candidatus Cryosericum septentrionale]